MAKRFTDSDKWKQKFFRDLKTEYKLLWLYMWDDCDHAGIWNVDIEIAQVRLKVDINELEAIEQFGEQIKIINNGSMYGMLVKKYG